MKISVVMPSYLEAENLNMLLPRIHDALRPLGEEYEILVIDSRTPLDETEQVCGQNGARCIRRQGGDSYGDAIRTGFACAGGAYTVVMDADGSHDPGELPGFYNRMEEGGWDLIIGSRYCRGGKSDNNIILKLMSWALNVTYRLFFSLRVRDVSDSFRMYRTDQIKKLELTCDHFDIVEEILIRLNLSQKDFKVLEIPISFGKRAAGESKRDLFRFVLSYFRTIHRLLQIKNSVSHGRTNRPQR